MDAIELKYVKFIDRYGMHQGLIMPGGYKVYKETLELAWESVNGNWSNIDWTKRQSAETLIGRDVWSMQTVGAKLALGRCIPFFIRQGMLPFPLVFATRRDGKPYKGGKLRYVPAHTVNTDAVPLVKDSASQSPRNIKIPKHFSNKVPENINWAAFVR